MFKQIDLLCVVAVFVCVFSFNLNAQLCSKTEAGSQTEACATGVITCGSANNQSQCENVHLIKYHVNDDFPSSCVATVNLTDCNQPLKQCKAKIRCMWANGSCSETGNPYGTWQRELKRTTEPCLGVGEEPF